MTHGRLVPVLLIALVGMIIITSQSPVAFAGFVDADKDGFQNIGFCDPVVRPTCDPDDDDPCNPDSSTEACFELFMELVEDVEDIMYEVDELVAEGDLDINNGQLNAILGKLEQAADKIESEKITAAIGALNAFINQINAFINAGSISPLDATALIIAAQNIINSL